MILKTIKTDEQYEEYLDWIDIQFDKKVSSDSLGCERSAGLRQNLRSTIA